MFGLNQNIGPQKIGFLLLPEFSMIAFTASIELKPFMNGKH